MFKIFLKWRDPTDHIHNEEMHASLRTPSPDTFKEIVKETEKNVENLIQEYGDKEFIWKYAPYERIVLYKDNKEIAYWSIGRYLRERRKK